MVHTIERMLHLNKNGKDNLVYSDDHRKQSKVNL